MDALCFGIGRGLGRADVGSLGGAVGSAVSGAVDGAVGSSLGSAVDGAGDVAVGDELGVTARTVGFGVGEAGRTNDTGGGDPTGSDVAPGAVGVLQPASNSAANAPRFHQLTGQR